MNYTILLVEDDKKLRELMIDYLSQNDFHILPASDGAQALSLFHENRKEIDLILLDGMLPMLDGLEVLRTIRSDSNVPVIMLSARETEEDQLQGFYSGADSYITKPFLLSVLREQITALLNRTSKPYSHMLARGALKIDLQLHRIYVEGQDLNATPK